MQSKVSLRIYTNCYIGAKTDQALCSEGSRDGNKLFALWCSTLRCTYFLCAFEPVAASRQGPIEIRRSLHNCLWCMSDFNPLLTQYQHPSQFLRARAHAHTHTHAPTHSSNTHTCIHTRAHTLPHSVSLSVSVFLSLSLSLTHTHTHTPRAHTARSHARTPHTHTHTLSLSLSDHDSLFSLSLHLTRTHTHAASVRVRIISKQQSHHLS